jgi:nitrogen fixation NifU-like protein
VEQQNDEWGRLVAELQRTIDEQEQALYSAQVLDHARNPHNLGRMEAPDAHAVVTGWCGDTMEIFLRLESDIINKATFMTDGCGPSVACGSVVTKMAQDKNLAEVAAIEAAEVITALDGLPPDHVHCATLAVSTLQQAIADFRAQYEGRSQ